MFIEHEKKFEKIKRNKRFLKFEICSVWYIMCQDCKQKILNYTLSIHINI